MRRVPARFVLLPSMVTIDTLQKQPVALGRAAGYAISIADSRGVA